MQQQQQPTGPAVASKVEAVVAAHQHGLTERDGPPVGHQGPHDTREAFRVVGGPLHLLPGCGAAAAQVQRGEGVEGGSLAGQLYCFALVDPQLRLPVFHHHRHVVPLVQLWVQGDGEGGELEVVVLVTIGWLLIIYT